MPMPNTAGFPDGFANQKQLDEWLTIPSAELIEFTATLGARLMILGAGGKMGPTLCRLAKRAVDAADRSLDVIAVSRFTDTAAREQLERHGINTISADLLDRDAVQSLPDSRDIINLTGMKFGTATNPERTWAINTLVPAMICERYPESRIVALSTGNVYPLVSVAEGGATEDQPLTPMGEYANAAIARERIYQHYSNGNGTRIARIRLNYAVEMRYGVLIDVANRVWNKQPIDVSNGWFNCIWQGDANEMIIRSLDLVSSPASVWNLSCQKPVSVRRVAERFGELFNKQPIIKGREASDALICNPSKLCEKLGIPQTPLDQIIEWTARWIESGGPQHGKATGFEVRDGVY